ncbi:hypothetical protein [Streptomyces sp. NPDC049881]|uniref:hypothetical protein n=1 Tax=Streptomyces sp. NPDC049881 TaxID=3155778 RepID=UPI0034464B36
MEDIEDLDDIFPHHFAERYFPCRHGQIEFVLFQSRLAALAWLRSSVSRSIDDEILRLEQEKEEPHNEPSGLEGEVNLALTESIYMLDSDTRGITSGAIIAAAVAALEALVHQLLTSSEIKKLHHKGFNQKLRTLEVRWKNRIDSNRLHERVEWLRSRRNSFAHRLLDESMFAYWTEDRIREFELSDEEVEQALLYVGEVAEMLEDAAAQDH